MSPTPDAPSPSSPARRFGAPRDAAVPRMETVRITAPDLKRRVAIERTRARLVFAAAGFALLFGALALKLADATIIEPVLPRLPEARVHPPEPPPPGKDGPSEPMLHAQRASITDRNGAILAISLPTASVYANPHEMIEPADVAAKLKSVLPELDEEAILQRLKSEKQFVYLARQINPQQELQINNLGIPGIYFELSERRHYPLGRTAAQVLGGVDVDGHGVAGVERFFEQRLQGETEPLRLSIDVRVQSVVRDELLQAMAEFSAIGACGIVHGRTHRRGAGDWPACPITTPTCSATPPRRPFQPLQSPACTSRAARSSCRPPRWRWTTAWSICGTASTPPIRSISAGSRINDFEGKHRFLYVPEMLAYSSNIGAAQDGRSIRPDRCSAPGWKRWACSSGWPSNCRKWARRWRRRRPTGSRSRR